MLTDSRKPQEITSVSEVPKTMKAWVFRKTGQPKDVLKLETDYPVPVPKAKQILVKVHAVALNPVGYKALTTLPLTLVIHTPGIPESDFSGVVAGGDLDGTGFKEGQEVFGIRAAEQAIFSGEGVLAEYAVAQTVVAKPANLSHAEVTGFPLAGLTAWKMVVNLGGLKRGESKRVFVNGGSGGVGVWCVQIAKAFGAYVVSTASPESAPLVKSLGADETIDYRSVAPLPAYLSSSYPSSQETGFDLIIDAVGSAELYYSSPGFLKKDGVYVDVGGADARTWGAFFKMIFGVIDRSLRPRMLGGTPRKYKITALRSDTMASELKEAAILLAEGKVKPVVDKLFPFEDALSAYERIMSGRAKGKVVIKVAPA